MSGGIDEKSVEAYDYYENKWTYLPNMIEERYDHASVSISSKLFVIGGYDSSSCEIFDIFERKFCYIKTSLELGRYTDYVQAVCIGTEVIVFGNDYDEYKTKVFIYNDETNEWKFIDCEYLNSKSGTSCIKYHP